MKPDFVCCCSDAALLYTGLALLLSGFLSFLALGVLGLQELPQEVFVPTALRRGSFAEFS